MIAVDTNLLVYAHRRDSDWHEPALRVLVGLAESGERWGIPWPCVHEFLAIATHPRIYRPPTTLTVAFDAVAAWIGLPTCTVLGEGPGYAALLRRVCEEARVVGAQIHDARVAALCIHNGVSMLWTADRDFSRFPGVKVKNPLV